jgi:hypothetical protein
MERRGKHWYLLGKRIPPMAELFLDTLNRSRQWLDDMFNDPARVTAAVEQSLGEIQDRRRDQAARASEEAVLDGLALLEAKLLNGSEGWPERLRVHGISERTAGNRMALALFSKRSPEVFQRLKVLGPTKLHRVARLSRHAAEKLHPDAEIDLPRGRVRLRHVSDRELEAYLRVVCPPRSRPKWLRARNAILLALRLVERGAEKGEITPENVDFVRSVIDETADRLKSISLARRTPRSGTGS